MSECVVYGLYSSKDDILRYIGQTTQPMKKRFSQHLLYSKKKRTAVQKWMNRALEDGFKIYFKVLNGDAVFNDTEVELIAKYLDAGVHLLNHTKGGDGVLGHSPSLETRKKRSESAKRYWGAQTNRVRWHPTEEQKRKIGDANRGNKYNLGHRHSEETKARMRESAKSSEAVKLYRARMVGVSRSPEAKKKMSGAAYRNWENRLADALL